MNVEIEEEDNGESILNLYRRLIALRRAHPVLIGGELRSVRAFGNLLSYERIAESERYLIILNLGLGPVRAATDKGIVVASTSSHRETRIAA